MTSGKIFMEDIHVLSDEYFYASTLVIENM